MSIISNASPDELSSPFYTKNETVCKKWEKFILEMKGSIKGAYNAYSYALKAEVSNAKKWTIIVKRYIYTSGNIFLSSKYQSLQETLIFSTEFPENDCGNFCISRSYFRRKSQNHTFYKEVIRLLKPEIKDKSLYEVKYKHQILTIVIHNKNEGFEKAKRILSNWK